MKFASQAEKLQDILTNFKATKPARTTWGPYRIEGQSLIYLTTDVLSRRRIETLKDFREWVKDYDLKAFSVNGRKCDKAEVERQIKTTGHAWKVNGFYIVKEEIARKVTDKDKTVLLGNSSILKYIGRVVAYGDSNYNKRVTKIQEMMSADKDFMMIPFTVFEQASLDLNKFHQIEKLPEEKVKEKHVEEVWNNKTDKYDKVERFEERHFTGASLFSVDGKTYLFDIDRGELKHGIFNPFLATIPVKVKNVKEAYEALKPKEVKDAEKKKLKVLRQGEWFFIPCKAPKSKKLTAIEKLKVIAGMADSWEVREIRNILKISESKLAKESEKLRNGLPRQMNLQAGNSRPNTVDLCIIEPGKTYCTGKVKHTGREHKDLILKGWYLAVPNTSIENFTVTGDVD